MNNTEIDFVFYDHIHILSLNIFSTIPQAYIFTIIILVK